jgi:hypothetical protein
MPQDPTPRPEVSLTADQAAELAWRLGAQRPYRKDSLLHRPKGSVRLVDRGDAYVDAEQLGPEGEVIWSKLLFPITAKRTPQSERRWLRQQEQQD